MRNILTFPNPVNEKAARTVAACVAVTGIAALTTLRAWLVPVLAVGFLLRTAFGARFDPFALLATRVVAPRLGAPRPVPGPPKRFAQAIGLTMTLAATVAIYAGGAVTVAQILLGALVVAATLESVFGFCVGCALFSLLMRAGLIPAPVCEACARVR